MKQISLLAASVAIALTGCGGSDSSGSTPNDGKPPIGAGIVITAIDGTLQNAAVYVDKIKDDGQLCETDTQVKTDEKGQAELPSEFAGLTTCVKAIAGQTVDEDRGIVKTGFDLSAADLKDGLVVSPMTHMVVEQMAADPDLSKEDAEAAVVEAVNTSGLAATPEQVFGNYIEDTSDADVAATLTVMGETLVDGQEKQLSAQEQLEVTSKVSEQAAEEIKTNPTLDNFAPVVDKGDNGVVVTPNERPNHDTSRPVAAQSVDLGAAITTIELEGLFNDDKDGSNLVYSVETTTGQLNGLTFTNNQLAGTPSKAGTYEYQLFATDTAGARSYPVIFKLTVTTPNQAPTVDDTVVTSLQAELDALTLTQGEDINQSVSATGLFQDTDGDVLTYKVTHIDSGLSITLKDDVLNILGKPVTDGQLTLTITANDGVTATPATAKLMLTIAPAAVTPEPTPELGFTAAHFKGGVWRTGSFDYGDAEVGFASLRPNAASNGYEFCFAAKDGETTLSRSNWPQLLADLEAQYTTLGADVITANDCVPATLNSDGTISMEGDSPDEVFTAKMVYQHVTQDKEYQILVHFSDGELFWLDSTQTPFTQFGTSPVKDGYHQLILGDDDTGYNEIFPLMDGFNYKTTAGSATSGTFEGYNYDTSLWSWTVDWNLASQASNNDEQAKVATEETDGQTVTRLYYHYRSFGNLYIGIGDNNKRLGYDNYGNQILNGLGDQGFFYVAGETDKDLLSVYQAWAPKPSVAPLLNTPLYTVSEAGHSEIDPNSCATYKLEGDDKAGKLYYFTSTVDASQCLDSYAGTEYTVYDYTIKNNTITATGSNSADGDMLITVNANLDQTSVINIMLPKFDSDTAVELSTNKLDVEKRLSMTSAATSNERTTKAYVTVDGETRPFAVTLQMKSKADSEGEVADADFIFEPLDGAEGLSCSSMYRAFENAIVNGQMHTGYNGQPLECYEQHDATHQVKETYVDFDFKTAHKQGGVYHFTLAGNDSASIAMSMTYNGDSQ